MPGICKRVQQVRQSLGLTQVKFAERIVVSTSYVNGIECGNKKINERIVRLICMEFDVNEHWLHTGEGEMYNKREDMSLRKIVSLFKNLPPKYQELVILQVDALVSTVISDREKL